MNHAGIINEICIQTDRDKCETTMIKSLLTASIFKAVYGVGQEADTPKESSSLLLVDFLVIPHADCDGIRLSDVSEEKNTSSITFSGVTMPIFGGFATI